MGGARAPRRRPGGGAPRRTADVPARLRAPDRQVLLFAPFAQAPRYTNVTGGALNFRQPWRRSSTTPGATSASTVSGPFSAAYDEQPAYRRRHPGQRPRRATRRRSAFCCCCRQAANGGDGRFAAVNFIQRLDARRGAAPAGPCDPAVASTLEVPCHAVYYFYGDARRWTIHRTPARPSAVAPPARRLDELNAGRRRRVVTVSFPGRDGLSRSSSPVHRGAGSRVHS